MKKTVIVIFKELNKKSLSGGLKGESKPRRIFSNIIRTRFKKINK